ncbi:MAG: hypothetical protein GY715_04980 [Planctomycetes bacterium]|nr:hypothetical protein [Planctomycetota bacterium]
MRMTASILAVFLFALARAGHAATVHVPGDFATIDAALADPGTLDGDVVLVGPGTWPEVIDLRGKTVTVRSTDGAGVTTIDGTGFATSVVRCVAGEGPATVIEGFTIRGGAGSSDLLGTPAGGGLVAFFASPTVRDCVFTDNGPTTFGGGMFVLGTARIERCTFRDNSSHNGGGLNVLDGSVSVVDCRFIDNAALSLGGGMFVHSGAARVLGARFVGNTAHKGGGFGTADADVCLTDSLFTGNHALSEGGGVSSDGAARVTILGNAFAGNTADLGGAIAVRATALELLGCTLSGNDAAGRIGTGGGIFSIQSATVLQNCVLWGNTAEVGDELVTTVGTTLVRYSLVRDSGGSGAGWARQLGSDGGGNLDADPLFARDPDHGGDGWGDDPETPGVNEGANDDYGDLRITDAAPGPSPCVDAGHNTAVPPDVDDVDGDGNTQERHPRDLDGSPRFADEPRARPDPGCGGPVVVDMGAYEHRGPVTAEVRMGDVNGDGVTGKADLLAVIGAWGPCADACCLADLGLDGTVGFDDLLAVIGAWGT